MGVMSGCHGGVTDGAWGDRIPAVTFPLLQSPFFSSPLLPHTNLSLVQLPLFPGRSVNPMDFSQMHLLEMEDGNLDQDAVPGNGDSGSVDSD